MAEPVTVFVAEACAGAGVAVAEADGDAEAEAEADGVGVLVAPDVTAGVQAVVAETGSSELPCGPGGSPSLHDPVEVPRAVGTPDPEGASRGRGCRFSEGDDLAEVRAVLDADRTCRIRLAHLAVGTVGAEAIVGFAQNTEGTLGGRGRVHVVADVDRHRDAHDRLEKPHRLSIADCTDCM
jgi:hypothetical protein